MPQPPYRRSPEKYAFLVKQRTRNKALTYSELAERLNKKFPEPERPADKTTVEKMLITLYREKPELKKQNQQPKYAWDPENTAQLIAIRKDNKVLTVEQIAELLNRRCPRDVLASYEAVESKLGHLYKNERGLRKYKKPKKPYDWGPKKKKEIYLIELKEKHPEWKTNQFVRSLNKKFRKGTKASARTVTDKLTDIYKIRPDLVKEQKGEYYVWTPEKDALVTRMRRENKDTAVAELAKALNAEFKEGKRAEETTVQLRLTKLFKKDPSIRKSARTGHYRWPKEQTSKLVRLIKENPGWTAWQFVKELNCSFPKLPKLDERNVKNKLTQIYRKNPKLKEARQKGWRASLRREETPWHENDDKQLTNEAVSRILKDMLKSHNPIAISAGKVRKKDIIKQTHSFMRS